MIIGKLSKKGQISIPKDIRNQIDLRPGDAISFVIRSNKIILEKITPSVDRKLSDFLIESESLDLDSISYQRKLRDEWN
ncbi:MAG: AbrB/MazE/SpoVT family DNA-binding domain-containing protein [Promethearchaeota archaeon]